MNVYLCKNSECLALLGILDGFRQFLKILLVVVALKKVL